MREFSIPIEEIFKFETARALFPKEIPVEADLKNRASTIDVIITTFDQSEMTNEVIKNFTLLEKNENIHIIIVESSGKFKAFKTLLDGDNISKIFVKPGVHEIHNKKGKSPWGMMFATAIGYYFTKAPYIFVSHNDMIALKENFLSFIKSKLSDNINIAAFTQSHIIPSVGCTIFNRKVLDNPDLGWDMDSNDNPYIGKNEYLKYISDISNAKQMKLLNRRIHWMDGGEHYVYNEIINGKKLYLCAAMGGNAYYWKSPFEYFDLPKEEAYKIITGNKCPFIYAPLNTNKEEFETKYDFVLKASKSWFFEGERHKRKYWRYCFDDEGDLMFIHHGRGATQRHVNRWKKFIRNLNNNILKVQ